MPPSKSPVALVSQACCLALVLVLSSVAPVKGQSLGQDVGLVTQASGDVTYWGEDQKEPATVQAFMKIRRGDRMKLAADSLVQLLYFANGRQETWRGQGTLSIKGAEAQAEVGQGSLQSEVKTLPAKVGKSLALAPLPLPRGQLRYSGAIHTMAPREKVMEESPRAAARPAMGPQAQRARPSKARESLTKEKELKEAEATFRDLRKRAPANDPTPELYYVSALADLGEYEKMEKVIDAMLAKRPGDATLRELKAWARSQALGE